MAVLFFDLRGVPTDEADDVRELLATNDIAFYETDAGNWGMSLPAIWLYDDEDLLVARPLFDDYQEQRAQRQRALYLQAKRLGKQHSAWKQHYQRPWRFILYLLAIALISYASVKWVFEFASLTSQSDQTAVLSEPVK